jgi:hypothetical protein
MLKTFLLSAVIATGLGLAASTGASAATVNGLALGSAAEQTSSVQDVRWYRNCRNVRVCRVGPYGRRCHVNRVCKRYWR